MINPHLLQATTPSTMPSKMALPPKLSLQRAIDLLSTGLPSPPPSADTAVLLLLANVFAPGAGTLVAGFLTHRRLRSTTTYVAIAQMCTVGLIGIGWVWAIAWGFLLCKHARGSPLSTFALYGKEKVVVRRWIWVPVQQGKERRWASAFRTREVPRVAQVNLR